MKIAVVVTCFGAAANIGGSAETYVKMFELPQEIADYVKSQQGTWTTVSFALEAEPPTPTTEVRA